MHGGALLELAHLYVSKLATKNVFVRMGNKCLMTPDCAS